MPKQTTVVRTRQADDNHQVVTVEGGSAGHCHRPCADCPWRVDAAGVFPAEAFRLSAPTAYDMAENVFACHQSGTERPRTCAGFLLRGADHNLAVRLARMHGRISDDVHDGGHALHGSYREMAIANGVDAEDPVLAECRP